MLSAEFPATLPEKAEVVEVEYRVRYPGRKPSDVIKVTFVASDSPLQWMELAPQKSSGPIP